MCCLSYADDDIALLHNFNIINYSSSGTSFNNAKKT